MTEDHDRLLNAFVFQTNVPFRRIDEEQVDVDPRLQDNSFDAKVSFTAAVSAAAPELRPRTEPALLLLSERSQRGLGPESQRRPQVHKGQIIPTRKDEKEARELPRRRHLHHSQLH